jgi:hypothetical protein
MSLPAALPAPTPAPTRICATCEQPCLLSQFSSSQLKHAKSKAKCHWCAERLARPPFKPNKHNVLSPDDIQVATYMLCDFPLEDKGQRSYVPCETRKSIVIALEVMSFMQEDMETYASRLRAGDKQNKIKLLLVSMVVLLESINELSFHTELCAYYQGSSEKEEEEEEEEEDMSDDEAEEEYEEAEEEESKYIYQPALFFFSKNKFPRSFFFPASSIQLLSRLVFFLMSRKRELKEPERDASASASSAAESTEERDVKRQRFESEVVAPRTVSAVLNQTQLLQHLSTFLNNKQARAMKQIVSFGQSVPLENAGTFACLSSPDLAEKLEALFELREKHKLLTTLRMLSVVFDTTHESRAGAWTDVLVNLSRFSYLEYLEVCIVGSQAFHTRPMEIETLLPLPCLVSLAFHVRHNSRLVHESEGGQWSTFAYIVTRSATVKHLSLSIADRSGSNDLIILHAPHLVSLRMMYLPTECKSLPCLRLLRLFAQPASYATALEVCPALEVLWCPSQHTFESGFLPQVLAALASTRVHTLVAFVTSIGVGFGLPPNHTLRQLYLNIYQTEDGRRYNENEIEFDHSVKAGIIQCLLKALPNLHTCVLAPSRLNEMDATGHVLADDQRNTGVTAAAAAAVSSSSSSSTVSQLQQFQPFTYKSYSTTRLLLPNASYISSHTRMYVPREYFDPANRPGTDEWKEHVKPNPMHHYTNAYNRQLATHYDCMYIRPSWITWEAHVGKQLVDTGLSILSPCGSCENRRPGMFDTSPFAKRAARQQTGAAAAASASASAAAAE